LSTICHFRRAKYPQVTDAFVCPKASTNAIAVMTRISRMLHAYWKLSVCMESEVAL
jgi:hypothetical protein